MMLKLAGHPCGKRLERIFELVAATIDQSKPEGDNWHQALLRQMATEIEFVRPRVVSRESRDALDEYRGFRHVGVIRQYFNPQYPTA